MKLTKTKPHFIRLPCHPYPTRSKLERYPSRKSELSQGSRPDDEAKDRALNPCKKRKEEEKDLVFVYLPRDIIFKILVRFPAEFLHNTARYVCKQWFEIVKDADFIRVHRQLSPVGFLIQSYRYHPHYYIDADTATLKVTKVEIQDNRGIELLCCCNSSVLLSDSTNREIFHVVNLMTKVKISLPPFCFRQFGGTVGLAVDSSGHYKVVCISCTPKSWQEICMRVFTIGVDKDWRFIDIEGIPISAVAKSSMLHLRPDCFGGFICWLTMRKCYAFGLVLDVNTETVYQFTKPNYLIQGDPMCVIGIGMGVGLIYNPEPFTWTLWKLTDVKSGQWTELVSIDLKQLYSRFGYGLDCGHLDLHITPVRLLKGYLWFYRSFGGEFILVRYNLSDKSVEALPFKTWQSPSLKPTSSSKHMIFTQELLASPGLL